MADAALLFGGDFAVSPSGDLAVAAGTALVRERLLRRLLTNPGDYIWDPTYGAGLGRFVGQPASAARIRAVVRSQVFREAAVARSPEPVIAVAAGADGTTVVRIRYADAQTGEAQALSFSI
jgi:phage baseplate assembly protein W